MEAMAVGLPIVATSAGGQQEVVRGGVNGWLVPVNDPAALADAMDELARAPHIAKARGESARQTIIERFDPISEVSGLSARLVELHEVSGATTRFGRTRV
jgi:glycosyltransferase involved in cell wall biosynthesis